MEEGADLVQVHVGRTMGLIVGNGLQQAGKERTAHLGLLGNERIHEHHGAAATVSGHMDLLEVARSGKAKSRSLVKAAGTQNLANLARELLLARKTADMVLCGRNRRLDATHAPQTQDFLDKVDLTRKVGAEARRRHLEVAALRLDRASQARKRALDEIALDGSTTDVENALVTQGNRSDSLGDGVYIDIAGSDLAGGKFLNKRARYVGDVHATGLVDLALETNRSVGDE